MVRKKDEGGSRPAEEALREQKEELEATVEELRISEEELASQLEQLQQSQEALRESEEKFRLLSEFTWDWIYWLDNDYRFVYSSPSCERITGYLSEEFLNDPSLLTGIVHPEDRALMAEHRKALHSSAEHGEMEFRIVRRDGEVRWIGHVCKPIIAENGVLLGRRSGNRDITERKRAEVTHERNRTLLAEMGRIGRIGGWELDIATMKQIWTDETYAIHDREKGTYDPNSSEELSRFEPGSKELIGKAFGEAIEQGKPYDLEVEMTTAKGNRKWVRAVCAPQVLGGKVTALKGTVQDITERKRMEEQFLQAQKLESVGRLAGGVAHDFNNLLTVILGYSDVVLTALPEDDPLRHRMEEIKSAGERAAALATQLLAFSRKQIVQPEVLCLNEVVGGVTKILQRMIGEDIELVTDPDPGLGRVKMDPVQVEQVLMNLAVNARDAMPEGGRLAIVTRSVESPPDLPAGRYTTLQVKDTGCGMTPEVRARLFEPFFTTKEHGRGTGLGLATVYEIVKQNKGEILVESEPGRGAAFTVLLPEVGEAREEKAPEAQPRAASRGKETVLVVEDDEIIRNLVRDVLEGSGYTVLTADKGTDALRLAEERKDPIHLLVTDVVMPGISGPEVAGHLSRYRPGMKVLYISGYTDDKLGRLDPLTKEAAFLQKPFRIETLTSKVREVLDRP